MVKKVWLLVGTLLFSATLFAQSHPSAEGGGIDISVGAQFSTFNPDWGCTNSTPLTCWNHQIYGVGPFVDVDHLLFRRLGAEGEARFLAFHGNTQFTYLAGPRVALLHYRRTKLSGKFLLGDGHIEASPGTGNYLVYAPGATLDYRMTHRLSARVDYEYQIWPSFKGNGTGSGGLTPNGLSFGVSYALRR